jgi:hypothetical protein
MTTLMTITNYNCRVRGRIRWAYSSEVREAFAAPGKATVWPRQQLMAGDIRLSHPRRDPAASVNWQDTGLVFTTHRGAALDAGNVRKMFKRVCTEAGIGEG